MLNYSYFLLKENKNYGSIVIKESLIKTSLVFVKLFFPKVTYLEISEETTLKN